jgi:transposase
MYYRRRGERAGRRLWRELREGGYTGGYTAVTDLLREVRPAPLPAFEVRFETPPGHQAQVDFAQFQVVFSDRLRPALWLPAESLPSLPGQDQRLG